MIKGEYKYLNGCFITKTPCCLVHVASSGHIDIIIVCILRGVMTSCRIFKQFN